MDEHVEQRFFGRICRVTVNVTVFDLQHFGSSGAQESFNGPPQSGQAHSVGSIMLSMRSKCSGKFLRRVGWPLAGLRRPRQRPVPARSACATLGLERLEAQRQLLDTLEPLGGLPEANTAQLRQLELQVLDLPLLLAQIDDPWLATSA